MSERGDTGRSCAFYTADYLRRCVDLSWGMEIDRYESLSRTACVITISATLAAASVVGFSFGSSQHVKTVCVFAVLVLCVSFALAIGALLRHEYLALDSPGVFADCVGRYESDFDDGKDAMIQLALTLDQPFRSLRSRNDLMRTMVSASLACEIAGIALMFVCAAGVAVDLLI